MKTQLLWLICMPFTAGAISVGHMTFAMDQDQPFIAKRVLNNNATARFYQVAIHAIERPGEQEVRTRPADGELLFAPKQLTLQAGQGEYYKFYYHGPKDNKERYYRVSFREVPTNLLNTGQSKKALANLEPIVVMDTILVVRPRETQFSYQLDKQRGTLKNTGNTFFKFLLKPGCDSSDEEGITEYLRPGDTFSHSGIKLQGEKFIIYNEKFINVDKSCI